MIFTDWLAAELDKRSWNHAELARRSGITRGALSHIFSHTRHPGVTLLRGIARGLHMPPEEVFRAAGILENPSDPDQSPGLGEWIQMFRDADELTREKMLQSARSLSGEEPRRRRA